MSRKLKKAVASWLRYERLDQSEAAEKALHAAFSRLPLAPVPAQFAEAVFARLGLSDTPLPVRVAIPAWSLRLAVGLSLLLGGISMLLLPGILASVGTLFSWLDPLALGTGALTALSQWVGEGLAVWKALAQAGNMLGSALSSPWILATLAVGAAMSIGAFRLLYELMMAERSSYHAGLV